jgi:predicted transcriptional regulator YheO
MTETELLLRESQKIVEAIGRMFAPFCEVVLHDLTRPEQSIVAIECPISGRKMGDATTEMGLARVNDPSFPDTIQNYANAFPDGRPAKSTSIGIRNSKGQFVAAICLNMDISMFSAMQGMLSQITALSAEAAPVRETLRSRSIDEVRSAIDQYAAERNMQARALNTTQRRELIHRLSEAGLLQLRGAAGIAADQLGISRASVYNALNKAAA